MAKKYSTFDKGDEMKVHIASIHNDKNSSNVNFLNQFIGIQNETIFKCLSLKNSINDEFLLLVPKILMGSMKPFLKIDGFGRTLPNATTA